MGRDPAGDGGGGWADLLRQPRLPAGVLVGGGPRRRRSGFRARAHGGGAALEGRAASPITGAECYRPPVLRRDLDTMARRAHDVVIVGGGIHGAAAAWEAASRGLSVALLEADDFGAGVSWNSLKTIHGGLRHLQRLDVAGLREKPRERQAVLAQPPAPVRAPALLAPPPRRGLSRPPG